MKGNTKAVPLRGNFGEMDRQIVDTLAKALRLRYADVRLEDGALVLSGGTSVIDPVRITSARIKPFYEEFERRKRAISRMLLPREFKDEREYDNYVIKPLLRPLAGDIRRHPEQYHAVEGSISAFDATMKGRAVEFIKTPVYRIADSFLARPLAGVAIGASIAVAGVVNAAEGVMVKDVAVYGGQAAMHVEHFTTQGNVGLGLLAAGLAGSFLSGWRFIFYSDDPGVKLAK
ncbi:MAG: hypothetical protein KGH69_01775 [Candidatus Micrarchaeota archaeon]|nr:hypothetical protein [Candidatus Micrarchaeota archaeon]